jgi:hypothetical protein
MGYDGKTLYDNCLYLELKLSSHCLSVCFFWRDSISLSNDIYQYDATQSQYSSVPSFHHSNCEPRELVLSYPVDFSGE